MDREEIIKHDASIRYRYNQYLNSDLWKAIRSEALENADYTCQCCGSVSDLQVHHLTYENCPGMEKQSDLIVLCRDCHEWIEREKKQWRASHGGEVLSPGRQATMIEQRKPVSFQYRDSLFENTPEESIQAFMIHVLKTDLSNGSETGSIDYLYGTTKDAITNGYKTFCENGGYFPDPYIPTARMTEFIASVRKEIILRYKARGQPEIGEVKYLTNFSDKMIRNVFQEPEKALKFINNIKSREGDFYMKAINLSNVQEAGTSTQLPAGGYVCRIKEATDVEDKNYLYVEFDIVEGEYTNYFKKLEERAGFWGLKKYASYTEKALPMFKRFCSAVTKSNPGFVFDGTDNHDEKTLTGKLIGLILREEEYIKNNGDIGTRLNVYSECNIDDIRAKNFKVPEKKVLPAEDKPTPTVDAPFISIPEGTDEEVPFN